MKKHLFCIIIGEPDNTFRRKLKSTFNIVQQGLPAVKFNFIEPETTLQLLREVRSKDPDMLFINADYLVDDVEKVMQALAHKRKRHQLVMLIAENDASRTVKDLTAKLEGGRTRYLSGHINKDNFSFDLLAVLIRFFVRRALS